ncbi:hypothetical protein CAUPRSCDRAFT_12351 [Caulochytrium protostelioides]|uniref:Lysophospholipid acyltransferase 5 n=1 Tax=Caulochytrium protostelioides TaxID=1555241 RepID=A0A4P9WV16_9FUNG|nr:hypothetical protein CAUPRSCDRAFT_12351 [Caulochytrium protostelioides]
MPGMAYMLIYQLVGSYFPVSRLVSPEFLDPQHHSLLYRVVIMLVTARVHATMYYAIWQLTEGALTMHGISFNGYEPESGSPLFTGLENLNVASLELATSLAGVISGFNMRTNEWTKHYAFKRIGLALGSRMGGQFLSLLWLCVWHGTAFGYFATFGLEFAMMTALTIANSYTADYRAWMDANHATDRQAKRHRLAFKAASWAVTWIWLSGGFTPFHLKSFERCAIAFKGGYWVIPAWVGLVILVNVPMKRFYLHGRRKARIEYSQSSTPASTMAAMTETTTTESKKMS